MVLKEEANASWSGESGDRGGGLPSQPDSSVTVSGRSSTTEVTTSNGQAQHLEQYTVITSPPATFTVSLSPYAHAVQTNGANLPPGKHVQNNHIGAYASVNYRLTPTSMVLNLSGTVKDGTGTDNILIGQGCSANVDLESNGNGAGQYTLSNYDWTVEGDTFDHFDAPTDGSHGHCILVPPAMWTTSVPRWIWKDEGTPLVFVGVTVTLPTGDTCRVYLGKYVDVARSDYLIENNVGPVSIALYPASPEDNRGLVYAGGTMDQYRHWSPPGMIIGGRVGTPPLFRSKRIFGIWQFVQIWSPNRVATYNDSTGHSIPYHSNYNGYSGLDGAYPYDKITDQTPALPWHTDVLPDPTTNQAPTYWMEDSPNNSLASDFPVLHINDTFDVYMMYRPDDNGAGSDWVPLHKLRWKWQANIQTNDGWLTYTQDSLGYVSTISSEGWSQHPDWSIKIENSNVTFVP